MSLGLHGIEIPILRVGTALVSQMHIAQSCWEVHKCWKDSSVRSTVNWIYLSVPNLIAEF